MDTNLTATVRTDETGKGAARKMRKAGKLPAVVYGRSTESKAIAVDPNQFDLIFRTTRNPNTVVNLTMGRDSVPCLVRSVQRHPVTRVIEHVDFYQLEKDQIVTVNVPVNPTGRAIGAALGGRIRLIRRELVVQCNYKDIPDTIDVDVTPLKIDDIVSISKIAAPPGCTFLVDTDFNVLSCYGKVAEIEEIEEEGEEGEEGEAEEAAE